MKSTIRAILFAAVFGLSCISGWWTYHQSEATSKVTLNSAWSPLEIELYVEPSSAPVRASIAIDKQEARFHIFVPAGASVLATSNQPDVQITNGGGEAPGPIFKPMHGEGGVGEPDAQWAYGGKYYVLIGPVSDAYSNKIPTVTDAIFHLSPNTFSNNTGEDGQVTINGYLPRLDAGQGTDGAASDYPVFGLMARTPRHDNSGIEFGLANAGEFTQDLIPPSDNFSTWGDSSWHEGVTKKEIPELFYEPSKVQLSETISDAVESLAKTDVKTEIPSDATIDDGGLTWTSESQLAPVVLATDRDLEDREHRLEFASGIALATAAASLLAFIQETPEKWWPLSEWRRPSPMKRRRRPIRPTFRVRRRQH